MQTITVNHELPLKAMHHPELLPNSPLPPSLLFDLKVPSAASAVGGLAGSTLSELDAMLMRDPNLGAMHGLRTVFLFNAGLVLTSAIGWEIWTMVCR